MFKPDRLRTLLTKRIKYFRQNPDTLQLFYANGHIKSTGATSLSWQYHYDLDIVVTDFPQSPDLIFLAIQEFIKVEQSELLHNTAQQDSIKFEIDPNNNETFDISISIPLSERVIVSVKDNTYQIKHADEPKPIDWQEMEQIQIYVQNEDDPMKADKLFDSKEDKKNQSKNKESNSEVSSNIKRQNDYNTPDETSSQHNATNEVEQNGQSSNTNNSAVQRSTCKLGTSKEEDACSDYWKKFSTI
ncbi:MAG: hypothetical protein CR960_00590 [Pasteurellales bacterium]|nr:MAG: hypothetical protein CR960_00590 [Pasteurellales bacterium]